MRLAMKQISVDLLITDTECIHLPTEAMHTLSVGIT